MIDVAEEAVCPVMDAACVLDQVSLIMGCAGVRSSFLRHAYRAPERYRVSGTEILRKYGKRRLVGCHEDHILEMAVELAKQKVDA